MRRSSWDHRRKVELNKIIDLSQNLPEKYGVNRGWQFSLRFNDQILDYKDPIAFTNGVGSPLAAQLIDDR